MLVEQRDCTTAYGVRAACGVGRTVRLYRAMFETCGMTMSQIAADYPRELEHTQNTKLFNLAIRIQRVQ